MRYLFFDLDGTLTDPHLGIVTSIKYALELLEKPCPSDEALANCIGPPLRTSFGSFLETSDRERIEEAMMLYRRRYADVGLFENEVYDGVPEMLKSAQGIAAALFVATSKPTVFAERIVKYFGLDHHFVRVYGAELDGRFDNKAELLAHLLATEGIAPESAVMVGDRDVDVLAAKANGLRSIGALWGYGSSTELLAAGADALCASPRDFLACLDPAR
jgi:phosphoglycolate phosphatase